MSTTAEPPFDVTHNCSSRHSGHFYTKRYRYVDKLESRVRNSAYEQVHIK